MNEGRVMNLRENPCGGRILDQRESCSKGQILDCFENREEINLNRRGTIELEGESWICGRNMDWTGLEAESLT